MLSPNGTMLEVHQEARFLLVIERMYAFHFDK